MQWLHAKLERGRRRLFGIFLRALRRVGRERKGGKREREQQGDTDYTREDGDGHGYGGNGEAPDRRKQPFVGQSQPASRRKTKREVWRARPKSSAQSSGAIQRDASWSAKFTNLAEKISKRLPGLLPQWSEPTAVVATVQELPSDSTLFIASSRPIRDIEAFGTPRMGIETFANRGLAGIDGNISTACGIALARKRTYAIVGDLAFLHDINGLLLGPEETKPNLTFIVISNDGGGIFSTLPQSEVPGFEKIFGTPHGRDLVAISESYGIPAVGVRTQEALVAQLARSGEGIRVIVAYMPDRKANAELLKVITRSLALL